MLCPVCKKEINDNSLFCSFCGVKIEKEESQATIEETKVEEPLKEESAENESTVPEILEENPSNEQTEEEKKAKKKKKIKRIITWSSIGVGAALVITLIVLFFTLILPNIQKNNQIKELASYADSMFDKGEYEEAYNAYSEASRLLGNYSSYGNRLNECSIKIAGQYFKNGDFSGAYNYIVSNDTTLLLNYYNGLSIKEKDYSKVYRELVKNVQNLDMDYYSSDLRTCQFYASLLPNDYKDINSINEFLEFVGSNPSIDKFYIEINRETIYKLWKYSGVRTAVLDDDLITQFLKGRWHTDDDSHYLSITVNEDTFNASWNFTVPDIPHKYFDIEDCKFIFTNGGDNKVCDIFDLRLDENDPCKMTIYSYTEDKTYVLTRDNPYD